MDPHDHPRSLTPLRQPTDRGTGNIWEESIYRMYGDIKTPKEPPPPPPPPANPKHQPQLGFEQPEEDEADDSFDEEIPWHPGPQPEPQWPRYSRSPHNPGPERSEQRRQAPPRGQPLNQQHNSITAKGIIGACMSASTSVVAVTVAALGCGAPTDAEGPTSTLEPRLRMPLISPQVVGENMAASMPVNIPFSDRINLPCGL